jgi:hypothetical protein
VAHLLLHQYHYLEQLSLEFSSFELQSQVAQKEVDLMILQRCLSVKLPEIQLIAGSEHFGEPKVEAGRHCFYLKPSLMP